MQNLIKKIGKSSIAFKKQVFSLKNWERWRVPTTIDFIFFAENTFPIYQCLQKFKIQNSSYSLVVIHFVFLIWE